jgi:hypothetical protein
MSDAVTMTGRLRPPVTETISDNLES